jgi:hypothetical protein
MPTPPPDTGPPIREVSTAVVSDATGFLVTAAIGLLALIIALAAIRVTREDLADVDPLGRTPTERAKRAGSNGRVLTA